MNEITIESFINFCDDMMIAEEGFLDIIHHIIEAIKKVINKIRQTFNKDLIVIDKAYIKKFKDLKQSCNLSQIGVDVFDLDRNKLFDIDIVLSGSMGTISKREIISTMEEVTKFNYSELSGEARNNFIEYSRELCKFGNIILSKGK